MVLPLLFLWTSACWYDTKNSTAMQTFMKRAIEFGKGLDREDVVDVKDLLPCDITVCASLKEIAAKNRV